MSIEDKNIPQQEKGNHVDIQHETTLNNRETAEQLFEAAKIRLLDVSRWGEIADGISAKFQLVNAAGAEVNRPAQVDDYFKIHIPGAPSSESGEGNDWVRIENIQDETSDTDDLQIVSIRVRTASNPQKPETEPSHFFNESATSTFVVKRKDKTVTAEVHGRNEVPNLHADGIWDTLRHVVVAVSAIIGFSNQQWNHLVKGLIEPKK
ncbi:MAG: hypothetical protein ACRYFL_14995 [Janthinobacterium lividum]